MDTARGGSPALLAGIEAGGTKVICGIGDAVSGSRETARIVTRDADATIRDIIAFFDAATSRHGDLAAAGLACFGPLDLDRASPDFGRITTTTKAGWQNVDLRGAITEGVGVPVAIETDVAAAALAELRHGPDTATSSIAYVTIGTGIGVGLISAGKPVAGRGHPEAGHLLVRRHPAHHRFAGHCPFHGDCLEGLASGPAIAAAWGASLDELPSDHPAWEAEADYLGQLCASLILVAAPERIVLGGGVMANPRLIEAVRGETLRRLAGYAALWADAESARARISLPASPEPPGLLGAYLIAERLVSVV